MNDQTRKELGQRIRARREELNLTQTELAKKIGKSSPAYIAFIEAGERNISAMDLMLLARTLATTTSALLGEQKNPNVPEVMQALRADKSLSSTDRDYIETFYKSLREKNV